MSKSKSCVSRPKSSTPARKLDHPDLLATCGPSRCESHAAMMRVTMSAPPPGGKPTTQRTAWLG